MKTRFTFFSVLAVLFTAALAPVDVAKAVNIIKGPYLQKVTSSSIVIMWETDILSDSQVDYGGHSVMRDESVTIHEIELTGLTSGSTYGYTVTSTATLGGATVTSDTFTFTAAPTSEESFRFVAYGNTRSNSADHKAVIQAIINSDPDLVIHTGDLVHNGNDYVQWGEQFFDPGYYLMINTPLLPILGNHEYSSGETLFFDFFSLPGNEQWFAFTYGGVRFIGLNTNIYSGAGVDYSPGSEQYGWLVEELESTAYTSANWHIVYFHHPPYTCAGHSDDAGVQDDLVPLFEQYGVDMVFNGHSHVYERYFHNGIYYIVTGGGGAPLNTLQVDTQEPIRQVGETTFHHCVIDVDSESLTLSARYNSGVEFDTITINRKKANNPNPPDGAIQVNADADLSWTAGVGAVSHDVYFGTNPDGLPRVSVKQIGTTYDPDTLQLGTTYYWVIDEHDSGITVTYGDVWSFTTFVPELPWSDGFESGSFAAGGWTTSGNATASSKADNSGIYGAEIKGTSWIEKAVSTVGFSNININYFRKTKGLDDGEYLYVEWSDGTDGNGWHELEATQDTVWGSQNLACGEGANDNAAFKLRFRTTGSNSAEYAYVDDVEIYESTVVTPPERASNPNPANGAPNVAVNADISWTAGARSQSHDVYFGTTASPPRVQQNQSGTVFDPGILNNNTTYYWRIDENNSYGTTTGDPWSFTTQSAGSTVYVSDIAMDIITGKKYRATATVKISPTLEGATVVGDWYFKGVLRQAGATGNITDGDAFITSMTTPAKSGDTFTFVVTDVIASGYVYDPDQGVTEGSFTVE